MVQCTPPLGWNTWNTFGEKIDEALIVGTADAMVATGLRDAGYVYVVLDEFWQLPRRGPDHRLVPNPAKFPNGMKALADYVHGKGLKLGLYSCAGNMTCGMNSGSFEYEFLDAETFASWGIDLLKYDYCFKPSGERGDVLYRRMGTALANCGRDILLSACSWGADDTKQWIRTTGSHMWRSTVDIFDSWESIRNLSRVQRDIRPYGGIGCFSDMDMLVVGMGGKGNCGLQGCSTVQYRTHFSLWALLGSPLMIGCDVRAMDEETHRILTNRDVLAVNQDRAHWQPFIVGGHSVVASGGSDDCFVWAKLLENGDFAIGCFNLSADPCNLYFCLSELGLSRICGKKLAMTDLWTGERLETTDEHHTLTLAPHDCRLYRAKVVDAG